jgi:hypothetical protein
MTNLLSSTTSGKKSKYASKKLSQKGGSYNGISPFFSNIPEFQFLKPLHKDVYPHLRAWKLFRLPSAPRPQYFNNQNSEENELHS